MPSTVHVTTYIVMLGLAYQFSGPMPIVAKYSVLCRLEKSIRECFSFKVINIAQTAL
jgi:hypothetical protein